MSYTVDANATTAARTGTIAVVTQTFTVTQAGNVAPQVTAISAVPPVITLPIATVNLNATVTDDGAPYGTLTTTWSQIGGVGSVTFGNPNSTNTTATFSTNGTYVLRLTASDGAASASNDVAVIVNARPQITAPPAVTNELATVNGATVVEPGVSVCFTVGAYDPDSNSLSCAWDFGDGVTSTNCDPCHVFANCGPLVVTSVVTDGYAPVTNTLMVSVACAFIEPMKLTMKSNFITNKMDSASLKTLIDLPPGFSVTNAPVTLDIGGATMRFTLGSKGRGVNGISTFKLSHTGKATSTVWQVTASLKGGWDTVWAEDGLVNATTNITVIVPVTLLVDTPELESFFTNKSLLYKAKAGKSGTAK